MSTTVATTGRDAARHATTGKDHPAPLLAVIGPSGVGKSSLVRELQRRGETLALPTFTTRPRRRDEIEGRSDHRFVGDRAFGALASGGAFLATGTLPGLPYRYGLPNLPCRAGPVPAVIVRAFAVPGLLRAVPGTLVYQVEDGPARTWPRLVTRDLQAAELDARISAHHFELLAGREVCHRRFVNGSSLPELADAVTRALRSDLPAAAGTAGGAGADS